MWHVGVDLHWKTAVIAAVDDNGNALEARTFACSDTDAIVAHMRRLRPFRAVVEASGTYRWFHDLITPLGTVLVAHPLRLRAMIQRRSKTDKLDAQLLAQLLRIDQVPLSYVPEPRCQFLRDLTRQRVRVGRAIGQAKGALRALLARHNRQAPYKTPFGPRGLAWFADQTFGEADNWVRDDLLQRLRSLRAQAAAIDARLAAVRADYPEVEALLDIHGVGLYLGLLIVAEIGNPERFRHPGQVAAYAGLTARVSQSGQHCYYGHITRQGSSWLRWALVQVAMHATHGDARLKAFYVRIRKRASASVARVAVARKLAEICFKRLRSWHRRHAA
jgi:transposase